MDEPERKIEPQNRVFNDALLQAFMQNVKIEAILPYLIKKNVIREGDIKRYEGNTTQSMKILIGLIQHRSYETFLKFIECIFLAQREFPAKVQSTIVDTMIKAVQEFDRLNSTTHAKAITDIQQKYMKQATGEAETGVNGAEEKASCCNSHCDDSDQLGFTMPADLEYVEEPVMVSFHSQGGQFPAKGQYPLDKYHGLSIMVPPRAVSEDQEVKLQIGVCCCGPFSINEQYEVASAFYVIVADGKFSLPVKVVMDHCLLLPEYKKCSEVLVLKSNRKVNDLYTFSPFTYPEVSPNSPELSFEIDKFCIICSILDEDQKVRLDSSTSRQDHSNPSSAQSSFDEEAHPAFGVEENYNQPPFQRVLSSTSSESGFDSLTESPHIKQKSRKGKADGNISVLSSGKKHCAVEYSALLFQNKRKCIDIENQNYRFAIFICTNCGAAQKRCKDHAEDILDSDVELATAIAITINSEVLKLEATTQRRGWAVVPEKTAEIRKSEVRFHSSLSHKELITRMYLKTYPPRLKFIAEFNDTGRICSFSCRVEIKGATTIETQNEVFFNISASIPRATGHSPCRQQAVDYSHTDMHLSQYYQPRQSSQLAPYYQRQASNQPHKDFIVRSDDVGFLISRYLCKYAHKWREIGLALGFQNGELKNISSSPPTSTAQQLLTELLSQWCQWPTDAHHHDPTMERLCGALRSELVRLGAVANELCELRNSLS